MKKIMVTLLIGSLLSAAIVTPVFAHGQDGFPHVRGGIFNPLWPVAAALAIPVAVAGAIASVTVPEAVVVAPAPVVPRVYSAPPAYYAPREYVAPRPHYAPPPPRTYHSHDGYYRSYRHGW